MNFFITYDTETNTSDFNLVFHQNKVVQVFLNTDKIANVDFYYKKLAEQCGVRLIYDEDPVSGAISADKWTEIKYNSEKSTDAYKYSNKYQPLHVDYGYFSFEIFASFFYCVEQAPFGGATTFIDVDTVVDILKSVNNSLLEQIQKQKIHFGRKDNEIANNDDYILQKDNIGWKINWNYYRALEDKQNLGLVEDFKNFIDTYIEKSGELKEIKLKKGEAIFFHDRRVLHGRNSFVGQRQLNKGSIAKQLPQEVVNLIASSLHQ